MPGEAGVRHRRRRRLRGARAGGGAGAGVGTGGQAPGQALRRSGSATQRRSDAPTQRRSDAAPQRRSAAAPQRRSGAAAQVGWRVRSAQERARAADGGDAPRRPDASQEFAEESPDDSGALADEAAPAAGGVAPAGAHESHDWGGERHDSLPGGTRSAKRFIKERSSSLGDAMACDAVIACHFAIVLW